MRVSFDDTVQRVDLTLTNGGHDYSCNHGTNWACSGNPLDDGVSFSYSAASSNT